MLNILCQYKINYEICTFNSAMIVCHTQTIGIDEKMKALIIKNNVSKQFSYSDVSTSGSNQNYLIRTFKYVGISFIRNLEAMTIILISHKCHVF